MKIHHLTTALLHGCALSLTANAADQASIVVTATRTAQTADETLAPVTVLTRNDIERQQATSVADALGTVPGIDISNNGGAGKATLVFLRGTEADHVLVLIDGIKVGSVTTGTAPFQDIPINEVERIEIVRGPRSSLYGSEAIGGVIQIFTRKGGGTLKPHFSVGAGRYHSYRTSAGLSGGGDRGWFNLNLSGVDTQGFNACVGEPGAGGCFTNEPDRDGYRNVAGSIHTGWRLTNGTAVDLHWLRAQGKAEFDGGFVNESKTVSQTAGAQLRLSPLDLWHIRLDGGRSWDQSENFKDGAAQTRFNTRWDQLSLQNDITVGTDHSLSLGLDYRQAQVDSTTDYTVSSRDNTGLFTQYRGQFHRHSLQVSLRRDDNQQFGAHTTGGAAWGVDIANDLRFTTSVGTAFKAPTFNELYYPGYGNPSLKPEDSQSIETGIEHAAADSHWFMHVYQTQVDHLIAYNATTSAPDNIDTARIRGLEAGGTVRLHDWRLQTSLTFLEPINRSTGPDHGNILPRRAQRSMSVDLDRRLGTYRIGATLLAKGTRYDDLANTRRLGAYTTVDVRVAHDFSKAWTIQGRMENLLGADYQSAAFYNQAGRSLHVALRYQP